MQPKRYQTKPADQTTDRDRQVIELYDQLVEIEERLIPTGLHVFGQPGKVIERAGMLRMIASFDRPEVGARALPELIAESLATDLKDVRVGELFTDAIAEFLRA